MTQASEYALLAAGSYDDSRPFQANWSPLPTGWTELTEYAVSRSGAQASITGSGFSAKVYQNASGEIVISLAGTEFGVSIGGVIDWTSGNLPLAIGARSQQALEAAQLYERVKADLGGNITFTGHSLGGGLASLMAVWFDRPAKVFAPAPFELAARLSDPLSTLDFVRSKLAGSALGIDAKLASYDPATQFGAREAKVEAWSVKGEVLEVTIGILFNWIEAPGRTPLFDAGPTELGVLAKHSIDLHAAGLLSPTFNTWAAKLTTALPRIFDSGLYGFGPTGRDQDFLVRLNRGEVGAAGVQPDGRLSHFAADLQKLGTNVEGLSRAAQDAILAQGIEWYYWQSSGYAGQEFFTQTGELLQYTTAIGEGLAGALNKANPYVKTWLTPVFAAEGQYSGSLNYAQWNLSTGSAATTASARDANKNQIFVGNTGADIFTGGKLDDMLLSGNGDDTLNGGLGDDTLLGGQGMDTYNFAPGFGNDVVIDSDGTGKRRVIEYLLSPVQRHVSESLKER